MEAEAQFLADTLANLVSGLGVPGKDKATSAAFYNAPALSQATVDALYAKNWLAGKVVDIPADDMVREWRVWKTDKTEVPALEETERLFRVRETVNHALKLAFKDGGSAILVGDGGDPRTELDVRSMRKGSLRYLHVVSRSELPHGDMDLDPGSAWFGRAKEYRIFVPDGRYLPIHPSRIIPFQGIMRADMRRRMDPWSDSIYERLHDVIRDATSSIQAIASMMQEAKLDVIKIPEFSRNVANPQYRAAVMQRFGLAMALKSINNALVFDAAEEYSQKTLTFQGIPEVVEKLLTVVAGAADMPVTRLLGRSPAGLNATGKADLEGYYSMVRSRQETYLRPALSPLDEIIIRTTLGRRPRGIFSEFRSLWSISDAEQSEIDQRRASAVESYARAGVFTQEALQRGTIAQLEEDSFLPGIGDAVANFPGVGPAPNQPVAPKPAAPAKPRSTVEA